MEPAVSSQRVAVIEIGSSVARAGFAGEASPRVSLSLLSAFGFDLSRKYLSSLNNADLHSKCFTLLSSLLFDHLQIIKIKEYHVLIVEPILCPSRLRNAIAYVLFKYFFIRKVSFQPDIFMSILSTGSYSGIIVDIGHEETKCIVIMHGRAILKTLHIGTYGISKGQQFLKKWIQSQNDIDHFDDALINSLFFKVAAVNSISDIDATLNMKRFSVPRTIRNDCVRVIVEGDDDDGSTCIGGTGVVGLLLSTLVSISYDTRGILMRHVVVCGGGAMVPGIAEAVCAAATARALRVMKTETIDGANRAIEIIEDGNRGEDVRLVRLARAVLALPCCKLAPASSPFPRCSLSWIGASVFASQRNNFSRFVELGDIEQEGEASGSSSSLSLPDWCDSLQVNSKKFIGGADPPQDVRTASATVVKLGFKKIDKSSLTAGGLQDYTTFYG